ncbi:MAG: sialate O-acetylesterase [Phycisphaerae bacterium]|nr:sialate O-acetylesterase [Phycisphaerae bacterium]
MRSNLYAALALLLLPCASALAEVKLAGIFTSHMVLQRDQAVPVWGWAEAGAKVTVEFNGQTKRATAGADGRWMLKLDPTAAGGPHTLTVRGANTVTLDDVLVGEVWLCSGQSNMAMSVRGCLDAEKEIASSRFPKIRMFTTAKASATKPQDDCKGQWQICSPQSVGSFSATAFFFGRRLHRELGVPIGLINSSWGGTAVEAWTSVPAQQGAANLKPIFAPWEKAKAAYDPARAQAKYAKALAAWEQKIKKAKAAAGGQAARRANRRPPRKPAPPVRPDQNQNHPGNLFNGMIHPLIPYGIRGAIWYQGERNAKAPEVASLYAAQLPLMIRDWRSRWQASGGGSAADFPFLTVQLPDFRTAQSSPSQMTGWVLVREGMFQTLASTKNTGLAVALGLGDAKNIHPKNKQGVGHRLAQWALARTYDKPMVPSGPLYQSMARSRGRIVLSFRHVGEGLISKGGGKLEGFAIAGKDGQWRWADARIVGETVQVSHRDIIAPTAVRYAWADNPKFTLYNRDGLPASPFRTDDWPK